MTARRRAAGFTLIELLAAMTILIVMVLLISRIFSESSRIWTIGAKRVESNSDGRAVMDFLVKEVSSALCDGTQGPLALRVDSASDSMLGVDSDTLMFVGTDQRSEVRSSYYRQSEQVAYKVIPMKDSDDNNMANRFRLVRYGIEKMESSQYDCYKPNGFPKTVPSGLSSWNPQTLAENVRCFKVSVMTSNGVENADFLSADDGKPLWVELYLELLGEDDALKASLIGGAAKEYCDRNVRRYVARAYLHAGSGR